MLSLFEQRNKYKQEERKCVGAISRQCEGFGSSGVLIDSRTHVYDMRICGNEGTGTKGKGLLKRGQRVMRWQGDQFCCLSAVLEKTQKKRSDLLYLYPNIKLSLEEMAWRRKRLKGA
jgi:hypothetical protein